MDCLHEQLKEHYKWFILESDNGYQNIYPNTDWTKEEYEELFSYIDKGWLIADTVISNGFIINKDWEGEHLWKPEEEKTRKEQVIEEWYNTRSLFRIISDNAKFAMEEHNSNTGKLIYYRKEKLLKMYNDQCVEELTMSELCSLFRNFPELYDEDSFVITEKTFRIKNYDELTMAYATYKQLQDPR